MQQRCRAHDQRVGPPDHRLVLVLVRDAGQHITHRLEPGPLLVVALHHGPWGIRQVGVVEHRLLGLGVLVPLVQRGQVDRAELPPLDRIELAAHEPAQLLGPGHREPELDQQDPVPGQHPLELRRLPQELHDLVPVREAHHPLDTRSVVPGPVEHGDLSRRRQVRDVALQVPLGLLALGRLVQGHHVRAARVQVLGEALDRAALARRVTALEQDDQPAPVRPDRTLQLQQLDLQRAFLLLVPAAAQLLLVRVVLAERPHGLVIRPEQFRLAVALVVDAQAKLVRQPFQDRLGVSVTAAGHRAIPRSPGWPAAAPPLPAGYCGRHPPQDPRSDWRKLARPPVRGRTSGVVPRRRTGTLARRAARPAVIAASRNSGLYHQIEP